MSGQMRVRRDQSEDLIYNRPGLPILAGEGLLSGLPNYSAQAHWHEDLEFAVLLSGEMEYSVSGAVFTLHAGDGVFINSRQLHANFSSKRRECEYCYVLFHPRLLCASALVEERYVTPALENPAFSHLVLREGTPWTAEVLDRVRTLCLSREEPDWPLQSQELLFQIWARVCRHVPQSTAPVRPVGQRLSALNQMVSYIQKQYQTRLSLEQIAAAGNVGKSSCCSLFQKYVHQSPIAYLVEYRLRKSIELLQSTDLTITEICYEVGFNGPSYFSESFKKVFHCSPMEFRKQSKTE